MNMNLIDTHCHIDVSTFEADCGEVLSRARDAGVRAMVVPGVYKAGWARLLALCAAEKGLYPALGVHPMYLDNYQPEHLDELRQLVAEQRLVALGEIGLDYFVEGLDRDMQQEVFEAQLCIAAEADLPVLLHVRKAHDQVLSTLRRLKFSGGGIVHAFNGSRQQADIYLGLGFKLGFGGTLTYERAKRIRALAKELPLESIVLETDAPDLPPANHRGERNSPEYLPEVLTALAELRPESFNEIVAQTTKTALAVLKNCTQLA